MRLFLARHGETDWNRERRWQGQTDTELNAVGRKQAELLAATLERCGIRRVHCSDLRRARETAEIVAHRLGLGPAVADADLRERHFGPFEGLTFSECAVRHPDMWERYRADRIRPDGAESDESLVARMRRGIERAAAQDGIALVVTHGGALRAYLRAMDVLPTRTDDFAFPNGSAVQIDLEKLAHRWVIKAYAPQFA